MKSIKAYSIFCFILLLSFNSCESDEVSLSKGFVTGADYRECICCGGYFIEIGTHTYRFFQDELPAGSPDFDLMDGKFPIKVFVMWKFREFGCMGDEITITKMIVTN